MKVFKYDTVKYPFREAIADILNVREEDLESLHETEEGRKALEDGKHEFAYVHICCMHYAELSGAQHRRRGKQPHYLRVWTRAGQTGARDTFHAILDCFMAEFVARRMAGAGDTAQEPGAVTWPVTGVTLTLQCRWRIKRTLLLELCCPRDNNKVNFSHLSSL